ncbi:hypothetical protein CIB43_00905 [Mesomycoplasma hyopneumoniae]|uniref:Uncharacterized protein n=1 Tax=Mesomycoplasma hyopneumoniae TaxID=2099 RepID=A0A223MB35_MESHO|nr:hypothetical protein CIB43_00905 [Mesomycoplasma hyopneumoniae]
MLFLGKSSNFESTLITLFLKADFRIINGLELGLNLTWLIWFVSKLPGKISAKIKFFDKSSSVILLSKKAPVSIVSSFVAWEKSTVSKLFFAKACFPIDVIEGVKRAFLYCFLEKRNSQSSLISLLLKNQVLEFFHFDLNLHYQHKRHNHQSQANFQGKLLFSEYKN